MEYLKQQWLQANAPDPLEYNIEKSGQAAFNFIDNYMNERKRKQRLISDQIGTNDLSIPQFLKFVGAQRENMANIDFFSF